MNHFEYFVKKLLKSVFFIFHSFPLHPFTPQRQKLFPKCSTYFDKHKFPMIILSTFFWEFSSTLNVRCGIYHHPLPNFLPIPYSSIATIQHNFAFIGTELGDRTRKVEHFFLGRNKCIAADVPDDHDPYGNGGRLCCSSSR